MLGHHWMRHRRRQTSLYISAPRRGRRSARGSRQGRDAAPVLRYRTRYSPLTPHALIFRPRTAAPRRPLYRPARYRALVKTSYTSVDDAISQIAAVFFREDWVFLGNVPSVTRHTDILKPTLFCSMEPLHRMLFCT